jgi:hypothetical protein
MKIMVACFCYMVTGAGVTSMVINLGGPGWLGYLSALIMAGLLAYSLPIPFPKKKGRA